MYLKKFGQKLWENLKLVTLVISPTFLGFYLRCLLCMLR